MLVMAFMSCAQKAQPLIDSTSEPIVEGRVYPPLFEKAISSAKHQVDAAIEAGIDVPTPKDMAGGYTHEVHKANYKYMKLAGALYSLTDDERYAQYVRDMLMIYADRYTTWPIHPTDRSYSTGRVFWQCLNDANWLVATAQGYEDILPYLSEEEEEDLEKRLFRPFADFISVENPQFFNRVHNHSTWGNAAVGMIGLVMEDEELIQRSLYGLQLSDVNDLAKDNDGGYIYENGKSEAGFFAQLDHAFSPDGYYTEGPYYQRYAMLPFMEFARALEQHRPDLKVFEYREGLLIKAVQALLYQTDAKGEFFPINDAQKGMSIKAGSVISALNIAYQVSMDPVFIDAARLQGRVDLSDSGLAVARAMERLPERPFAKPAIQLTDGQNGDQGAIGILRQGEGENEYNVIFKYAAQGLGHGHYDRLSYAIYDGDTEVLQDYGAARWVNIDQKAGGRYLPENFSWAKQTIAHNGLIMDRTSQFGGKYDQAKNEHAIPVYFNVSNPDAQCARAMDTSAYAGVTMDRTLLLLRHEAFVRPLLIDFYEVVSDDAHDYEMAYQYAEHVMTTSWEYERTHDVMGEDHGYQHLYQEAIGDLADDGYQFNWMKDKQFYTITGASQVGDAAIIARLGANDPDFNLRKDEMLIHQRKKTKSTAFLAAIESHGIYSARTEVPIHPYTAIESVSLRGYDESSLEIVITLQRGGSIAVTIDRQTGQTTITDNK